MHLASVDLCARDVDCSKLNTPLAIYARDAVRMMDEAGVAKGVILSCAYLYGLDTLKLDSATVAHFTRVENEFVAAEVARYPERLIGFLSVDPLQSSALSEIEHWRGSKVLVGIKLHLRANDVHLSDPEHRQKLRAVFALAAREHLPIAIHVGGFEFNPREAELFIDEVLPSAGENWVQIAHAAGGMPDKDHAGSLKVFADHIERDDPVTRHLLFDVAYVPSPEEDDTVVAALATQLRRLGMKRLLFASDFDVITPVTEIGWLKRLGFSPAEMDTLRENCAPWAC